MMKVVGLLLFALIISGSSCVTQDASPLQACLFGIRMKCMTVKLGERMKCSLDGSNECRRKHPSEKPSKVAIYQGLTQLQACVKASQMNCQMVKFSERYQCLVDG